MENLMICALEYSASQDSYNIDDLKKILEQNLENSLSKKSNDYQIIYIGSYEHCLKFSQNLSELKKNERTH